MAKTANDTFEERAERFYRDTGMMAPGKDQPAAMGGPSLEDRLAAWTEWCARNPVTPPGEAEHGS